MPVPDPTDRSNCQKLPCGAAGIHGCWMLVLVGCLSLPITRTSLCAAAMTISPTTAGATTRIEGIPVHRVPLWRRREDGNNKKDRVSSLSPYCLVASTPPMDRPEVNFLATQVWPSARTAAICIQRYGGNANTPQSLVEFGCGPGLPSLTAGHMFPHVVATDVDPFALQLVQHAAREQSLSSCVSTQLFDLVQHGDSEHVVLPPPADLYLLSDVFESAAVARGAARIVTRLWQQPTTTAARVWVFCQSDRAQRDVFVQQLQEYAQDRQDEGEEENYSWTPVEQGPPEKGRLWLCDVDETKVVYG